MKLLITSICLTIGLFCVACSSVSSHEVYGSESGAKIPINQWQFQ